MESAELGGWLAGATQGWRVFVAVVTAVIVEFGIVIVLSDVGSAAVKVVS